MAATAPLYDLVLMLDPAVPDEERAAIRSGAEDAITAAGEVVSKHDWGVRAMTFEIDHRKEAEYHLIQFHGPASLLENLQRTLRIADGVMRFRIIRLAPGTPPPPAQRPDAPVAEPEPASAA